MMKYTIKLIDQTRATSNSDCLIIGVFLKGTAYSLAYGPLDKKSRDFINSILEKGDLIRKLGKTLLLYSVPGFSVSRILLVYCGEEASLKVADFRKVTSAVAGVVKSIHAHQVITYLTDIEVEDLDFYGRLRQTIALIEDCFYSFDRFKTKQTDKPTMTLEEFVFNQPATVDQSKANTVIEQSVALSDGIKLTKDLANLPANICTPHYMAEQAKKLADDKGKKLKFTRLKKEDMEGMGAFLAVAQGSEQAPQFVVLEYQGIPTNKEKPVVLVGKGVTFDSGGICLKPAAGMEEMKFDMSGAAAVLGILKTISALKLSINVVGIMPLTENLPSGKAAKPGDVVTTLSGQTVEIINTDAEGRLILADALTYSERFNPEVVIDMATLTGAVVVSLGDVATGMMSNNVDLAQEIEKAGNESYDRVWALPLWEDYQEQVDSNIADISNIGMGGAKSITAACFLSRFTRQFPWAHLDIAGTAWKSGKDKTATGRPVSLLVQFLLNRIGSGIT